MHPAAVSDSASTLALAPVSRRAAREAAGWLVRLQAGDAKPADLDACERWRGRDDENERAWQRALQVGQRFGAIPADIGMQALDRRFRGDRRKALKTLALLIAAGPVAWAAYRAEPWREWTADHRTAVGERSEVTLADGTRVSLNTDSAIRVLFDAGMRLIDLVRGEILIETAHESGSAANGIERPLVVATAQGHAQAFGALETRFSVRQRSHTSQVAVFEGSVAISAKTRQGERRLLSAGQQIRFGASPLGETQPVEANAAGWTHGVLYADRMRLADFAAELDRYRPGLLRCAPEVAELRITGAFQLSEPDRVLSALAATLPVQLRYRTRYWATLEAAEPLA